MSESKTSRILYYDIETAPLIGSSWQTWDTNLIWIVKDWYILSFSWKWGDEKKVYVLGLTDFKRYQKDPENDIELVKRLFELFSEADIVVAHNGDRFDQKKVNARIAYHGLNPPAPYKQIDTLKVARRYFAFTSNKLNDLGVYLKCGQKLDTGGADLWRKCLLGDPKAWKKMLRYNKQDVVLLEQVYMKLRPWMNNHPSLALMEGRPDKCPKCSKGPMIQVKKRKYANVGWAIQYQCNNCGGYATHRKKEQSNVQFTN